MSKATRYPPELRERTTRMVLHHRAEYGSEWATIVSIATKLGMTSETLRRRLRRDEVDASRRVGETTEERERLRQLERENRGFRRAMRSGGQQLSSRGRSTRERRTVGWLRGVVFVGGIGSTKS
jgi:transposase